MFTKVSPSEKPSHGVPKYTFTAKANMSSQALRSGIFKRLSLPEMILHINQHLRFLFAVPPSRNFTLNFAKMTIYRQALLSRTYQRQNSSAATMDAGTGVAAQYLPNPAGRNVHGHGPAHASADHGLGQMMSQFTGLSLGGMGMHNNSAPLPLGPGHFVVGSEPQFLLAPMAAGQPMGMSHSQDHPYNNYGMPAGSYGPPYVGLPMPLMPYTPGRANATQPRVERINSDVPGLENRRGSYSTTESTPATPFYGTMSQRDGPRVASLDRSAYTTPSPQQMGLSSLHGEAAKSAIPAVSDSHIDDLLKKDPAIPRAVPAVFTPPGQMKSLEQSLENRIPGNRNVYIRGLHPTTDDRLLYEFAARFGAVETSKAIIDTNTGACKGYATFPGVLFQILTVH